MTLVAVFLAAVVGANLTVAAFGPSAVIPVAFIFVALDLVARDGLHELWKSRRLPVRMGLLIAGGGALSAVLNMDAARVALASFLAFSAAQTVNGLGYWMLDRWPKLAKINVSNAPAATVDSWVFLTVAFGAFMPALVAAQTAAKVSGGALWSLVLVWVQRRRTAEPLPIHSDVT